MILSTQLAVTFGSVLLCAYNQQYNTFWKSGTGLALVIIGFVLSIICSIALICFKNVARKVPNNYILLGLYTLSMSAVVTFITATYTKETVVMAMLLTLGVCLGLTLYALTTKTDFTTMGGFLFSFCIVMIIMTFLLAFAYSKVLDTIICVFGVLLFSMYLIYDT